MIRVLQVRVDEYDMNESLDRIGAFIAHPEQGVRQVVTINPEGIWLACHNPDLADIVERAGMVTPDGNGILWAARQLGTPLRERVTGIDLLEQVCARAAKEGWRIYLLGAKPGLADTAAANLTQRYPGLHIVGCDNGYFRDREEAAISAVHAAQPDILFAALGMPYQERWLDHHRTELGATVTMGVGGSFDVLAGVVKRAPKLIQTLKLEWLWRLLKDPKRWRRYLIIPRFMIAVRREARSK